MQARLSGVIVLVALIVLASFCPLSYARQPKQGQGPFSSCPQKLRVLDRRGELADAQLFIGLPEKKEELKRPRKQQQWVLAALHRRAAAKKEGLFLQCRYKDLNTAGFMKASITMPVPPQASACVVAKTADGSPRITCQ